jgi:hypothetical protein
MDEGAQIPDFPDGSILGQIYCAGTRSAPARLEIGI